MVCLSVGEDFVEQGLAFLAAVTWLDLAERNTFNADCDRVAKAAS
jgi:hypothetical protein